MAILYRVLVKGIVVENLNLSKSYLFRPKVEKIWDYMAWKDAATQTFFNLGLAYGTVIAYSSFNPIKNNCQKDAFFVATINAIVSVRVLIRDFGKFCKYSARFR